MTATETIQCTNETEFCLTYVDYSTCLGNTQYTMLTQLGMAATWFTRFTNSDKAAVQHPCTGTISKAFWQQINSSKDVIFNQIIHHDYCHTTSTLKKQCWSHILLKSFVNFWLLHLFLDYPVCAVQGWDGLKYYSVHNINRHQLAALAVAKPREVWGV